MECEDGFELIKFSEAAVPPEGIRLFGKFIAKLPEEDQEKAAAAGVKRLVLRFDRRRYPCLLFSRGLWALLGSVSVSETHHRPKRVITRTLTPSDVNKQLARLAIPRKQLVKRFLKHREEKSLKERDDKGKPNKIQVTVVDPVLTVRTLNLARWNYHAIPNAPPRKNWSYALNSGWMDIVSANQLAAGDTIQVWRFRKPDASLGFIIFKI